MTRSSKAATFDGEAAEAASPRAGAVSTRGPVGALLPRILDGLGALVAVGTSTRQLGGRSLRGLALLVCAALGRPPLG